MIKLGERRLNPGHIIQYYPKDEEDIKMDGYLIIFELSDETTEEVSYTNKEERDGMLDMIDKYLVSFDNGTITVPDFGSMPTFVLGGQGPEEGPGGISMQ